MTPLDRYTEIVASGDLAADTEQQAVLSKLTDIALALQQHSSSEPSSGGFFSRLFQRDAPSGPAPVQGLYLWGGVGRGKTLLTDLFYESVGIEARTRLHFHRFMKFIHDELRTHQHLEDPLVVVADDWISRARLLVLDEIHVNDITDAMLLGRLLTEMFKRGMTLVATSNFAPDDLYRDGLQRDRFLPAIAQIKAHTLVYQMGGDVDYRLRVLEKADIYLDSSLSATPGRLKQQFEQLSQGVEAITKGTLQLNRRELPIIAAGNGVLWTDFESICNTPRSTNDYIAIATLYHTLIVSDIPILDETRNDAARRFVNLIDELYDRHVNLIVSAAGPPDSLYTGKRLAFEFTRTTSRLQEMQTKEYLGR